MWEKVRDNTNISIANRHTHIIEFEYSNPIQTQTKSNHLSLNQTDLTCLSPPKHHLLLQWTPSMFKTGSSSPTMVFLMMEKAIETLQPLSWTTSCPALQNQSTQACTRISLLSSQRVPSYRNRGKRITLRLHRKMKKKKTAFHKFSSRKWRMAEQSFTLSRGSLNLIWRKVGTASTYGNWVYLEWLLLVSTLLFHGAIVTSNISRIIDGISLIRSEKYGDVKTEDHSIISAMKYLSIVCQEQDFHCITSQRFQLSPVFCKVTVVDNER